MTETELREQIHCSKDPKQCECGGSGVYQDGACAWHECSFHAKPIDPPGDFNVTGLLNLSKLVMKLGEVKRVTRHPSGQLETDTTHTLMLALSAGYYAAAEGLNTERVLFFSLAHDMVEAYAGDTPTLHPLNEEEQAAKDKREADALERIWTEVPWLGQLIEDYEKQDTPEARFVHMMDKAMPRLTHAHNACRVPQELGLDLDGLMANMEAQTAKLAAASPDLPFAKAILDAAAMACETAFEPEGAYVVRLEARDTLWLTESQHSGTTSLADAGVFTKYRAETICKSDGFHAVELTDALAELQASIDALKEKAVIR